MLDIEQFDEIDALELSRAFAESVDTGRQRLSRAQEAGLWTRIGLHLQDIARHREALECFGRAMVCQPGAHRPRYLRAFSLERLNRIDEYAELVELGERLGDDSPRQQLQRATLEFRRGRAADARAELQHGAGPEFASAPASLRAAAQFLLGKAAADLGDHDDAFDHWCRANRIVDEAPTGRTLRPRAEQFRQNFLARQQLVSHRRVEQWCKSPTAADDSPIFLLGFPRSGTTLLRRLIGDHSQVFDLEEKPLFQAIWDEFERPERSQTLDGLDALGVATRRAGYWQKAQRFGYTRRRAAILLDKFPLMITALDLIARFFPGSKIIVALRHPADVISSNFANGFKWNPAMWHSLEFERLVGFYVDVMRGFLRMRDMLPNPLYTIRYESLVADPKPQLAELLEFCGLGWEAPILQQHHARRDEQVSTPSYHQVCRPIYSDSVGRWRKHAHVFDRVDPALVDVARDLEYLW